MNQNKKARATALGLGLAAFGTAAFGQAGAPVFHYSVPVPNGAAQIGLRGAALGYESRVSGAEGLELQYAILHALVGWDGSASTMSHDQALLTKAGVQVTPLADRASRVVLNDKLQEIRTARNFGVPSVHNARKPISLQRMAERHRELIEANSASIKIVAPGAASYSGSAPDGASAEYQLRSLRDQLTALTGTSAGDDAGWRAGIVSINATLAKLGGPTIDASAPRAASVDAILSFYDQKRASVAADAAKSGRTLSLEDATTLRGRYASFFDGAKGADATPTVNAHPSGGAGNSSLTVNAPTERKDSGVPGMKAGTNTEPSHPSHGEHKPGLFGMLGSLFGALFRTVGRVVGAVVKGVVGVVKAILS